MAGQPLFSMVVTAGIRQHRTQADLGADDWIRLSATQYLTKLDLWLNDAAGWPAVLFVEVCQDGAAVAAATEAPLWWGRVYRDDAGLLVAHGPQIAYPKNEFTWFQPLEATQMDIQFRRDTPYPTGTIYKPPAGQNFAWIAEYFPYSISQS